jgi:hypothetical protein
MKSRARLSVGIIWILALYMGDASASIFTVPDWVMKSCVFVMKGDKAEGTGFFIGVREQDKTFCYFVTAKHVMQSALANSTALRLRLNKKEEEGAEIVEFSLFPLKGKPWIEHKNPAIDLAVAPLAIFDKIAKYDVHIPSVDLPTNELFASECFLSRFKVRPGDQAFTLGLVPYLFSKDEKNIIMTRSGTISMVGERELSLPGGKQKAHFLDCAAFGGQSGGPAFVLLERSESGALIAGWRIALLGIVTEFVPSPLRYAEVTLAEREKQKEIIPIENTGISKVVPVDYLIDILFAEEQRNFRKTVLQTQKKSFNKRTEDDRQYPGKK